MLANMASILGKLEYKQTDNANMDRLDLLCPMKGICGIIDVELYVYEVVSCGDGRLLGVMF